MQELIKLDSDILDFFKYLPAVENSTVWGGDSEEVRANIVALKEVDFCNWVELYRRRLKCYFHTFDEKNRITFIKNETRSFEKIALYLDPDIVIDGDVNFVRNAPSFDTKTRKLVATATQSLVYAPCCISVVREHCGYKTSGEFSIVDEELRSYIIDCWLLMGYFFRELDEFCLSFDIDIMELQRELKIDVYKRNDPNKFILEQVRSSIEQNKQSYPQQEVANDEKSGLKKQIAEMFETIDSNKGWKYAFRTEKDYEVFVGLLADFFHKKEYSIPETIILQQDSKTRVARLLGDVRKLFNTDNSALKKDEEFLKIVRVLSPLNKEPDLCKALTR